MTAYPDLPNNMAAPQVPARLETARLVLRKAKLSDAVGFARGMSNVAVSRNTVSFPRVVPVLSAEFWVYRARANFDRGLSYAYVITPPDQCDVAGVMEIFTNKADRFEIGYWIAPDYWGQGYATEAGRAVIETLCPALNITEIEGVVYEDNPGSCRVLEKLGFKHIGPAPALFSVSRGRADCGYRYLWRAS